MKLCSLNVQRLKSFAKANRRMAFASVLLGLAASNASAQSPALPPLPAAPIAPVVSAHNVEQAPIGASKSLSSSSTDRYGLPIPLIACDESGQCQADKPSSKSASPVQSAVASQAPAYHPNNPNAIRLVAGQAPSNDVVPANELSESLIDIDIPMPGVPSAGLTNRGPAKVHLNASGSVTHAPRRTQGAPHHSHIQPATPMHNTSGYAPEVVQRGTPMRVAGAPVQANHNPVVGQEYESNQHSSTQRIHPVVVSEAVESLHLGHSTDAQYHDTASPSDRPIGNRMIVRPSQPIDRSVIVNNEYAEAAYEPEESLPVHAQIQDSIEVHESNTVQVEVNSVPAVSVGQPEYDASRPAPPSPTFAIEEPAVEQSHSNEPVQLGSQPGFSPQSLQSQQPIRTVSRLGNDGIVTNAGLSSEHHSANVQGAYSPSTRTEMHQELPYGGAPQERYAPNHKHYDTQAPQPQQPTAPSQQPAVITGEALVVGHEDTTTVNADSPIREYSVEHPAICKLIKTSENTISLIGLREGNTRIAIMTANAKGEESIEIREVRISSGPVKQTSLRGVSREVSQTIAKLYPRSQIEVVPQGTELIVRGYVESEKDARKIISLVRKTTLTPVVDQLQSFGR